MSISVIRQFTEYPCDITADGIGKTLFAQQFEEFFNNRYFLLGHGYFCQADGVFEIRMLGAQLFARPGEHAGNGYFKLVEKTKIPQMIANKVIFDDKFDFIPLTATVDEGAE